MSFRYEKQFSKQQNIVNFLVRQDEGATIEDIAKEVFGQAPEYRQVNQTYAREFFKTLEEMLYWMIKSGHIDSEDTRYYFKASHTDVPMESDF
jgi:hypothetical protein